MKNLKNYKFFFFNFKNINIILKDFVYLNNIIFLNILHLFECPIYFEKHFIAILVFS